MNLSYSLLTALRAAGARELFGLPGDFILPFLMQAEESGILPLYTLSHEPSIGFAADAAARFGGGIGVAVVTYGAGALNLVNAVAAAYAEKVPLVVISGAPGAHERNGGLLLHHQVRTLDSQLTVFAEITCAQAVLNDAATAPDQIARALRRCVAESRPVYIELPRDMADVPCAGVPLLPAPPVNPDAVAPCVADVAARLEAARRPVLMVGIEVRRFGIEEQVAALARHLRVPVVTTVMGRGVLTGHDVPLLGPYLGSAGDPAVADAVEESDLLLMLGVLHSDTNFAVADGKLDAERIVLAVDQGVVTPLRGYPDVPLRALVDGLLAQVPAPRRDAPAATFRRAVRELHPDGAPIWPLDVARGINDILARVGPMPIVSDMGDCFFTALDIEDAPLLAPGYYATMGYGVPAALGLQARSGQRPIVLVGDGAFQMTGWELGHCRRRGWDPIVILFNNAGWGMLRSFEPDACFNELGDWHFAALAEGLGGHGVRVGTRAELAAALEQAVATRGRFQMIEVMLPMGAQSDTLARFVMGARRRTARPIC
ncbi:phenylpyruvate decarboxylase [Pseudoduganella flava]|uniref:Phenylpyruvate decarboxylase n=1 Tax=Pseudoduganella flava TaxID=871742 RepID=A0A562PBH7_9BURK|nr:indolepyruvate/phenylpyruvate decarboxylase [Pseudoduganella flava]QGZ38003.1 indolepyruvate/phenylpyruvate decarboxylase [Pseudoduganella flava]TWI41825.1 phenylpyruvate decarboxylase [Pseudoduganella flava]